MHPLVTSLLRGPALTRRTSLFQPAFDLSLSQRIWPKPLKNSRLASSPVKMTVPWSIHTVSSPFDGYKSGSSPLTLASIGAGWSHNTNHKLGLHRDYLEPHQANCRTVLLKQLHLLDPQRYGHIRPKVIDTLFVYDLHKGSFGGKLYSGP